MKVRESGMPEESLWVTFFDPEAILRRLLVRQGDTVVEFGCGYGIFTEAASRLGGSAVHALDIDPVMLAATKMKIDHAELRQVHLIQRDFVADGTGLPALSVDYAMLFNILHAPDPMGLICEASRVLRPGGRVGVIHWNPSGTPRGPDPSIRPRPEQCQAWLIDAGFEVALPPIALPPFHFGLVGRKALGDGMRSGANL